MSEPLEPFDVDVQALLDRAKPIAPLDAARLERLHARVATQLLVPGGGGGAGQADGGVGDSARAAGHAAGAKASSAALSALVVGVFAAGVVAGVVLDRTVGGGDGAASPAPLASTERLVDPAPVPSAADVPWNAVVPDAPASARPLDAPKPNASRSPDLEPSARGLAAERALLDVARGALARGEPTEALAAVRRHGTEYPRGALVEEREALAVKALVAAGRLEEARIRAADFERRFPNGLMLRVVRAAVGP